MLCASVKMQHFPFIFSEPSAFCGETVRYTWSTNPNLGQVQFGCQLHYLYILTWYAFRQTTMLKGILKIWF